MKYLAIVGFLLLASCASRVGTDAAIGGALGGGTGLLLGGTNGAIAGGLLGAGAGALLGTVQNGNDNNHHHSGGCKHHCN